MLSKAILDYNEATRKAGQQDSKKQAMTINLAGLVMGNAWTDPFHDNSATVSFYTTASHARWRSRASAAGCCNCKQIMCASS